jgi:hypothetical protein
VLWPEEWVAENAEPILRRFTDYKFEIWKHTVLDGMDAITDFG